MVDNVAPVPSQEKKKSDIPETLKGSGSMLNPMNPSAVKVTIAGAGGCGINLARPFKNEDENGQAYQVLYFDTSMTNSRRGEEIHLVSNGSGSGSNRAEHAGEIEKSIPQLTSEEIGVSDVAVVMFSLAGGSGSVLGPLLIREYHRRAMRVIAVVVVDNSSSIEAKNTLNTLKTLQAICKSHNLYLPMIVVSNDVLGRRAADEASAIFVKDLIDLLTQSVYEVDRNDRLNWINPTKVVNAQPGLKLMAFTSDKKVPHPEVILGLDSTDMVDSLLILQSENGDDVNLQNPPMTRLRKTGIYASDYRGIMGRVSSDITSIENVIDQIETVNNKDKSQKYKGVDRLSSSGEDDLVL